MNETDWERRGKDIWMASVVQVQVERGLDYCHMVFCLVNASPTQRSKERIYILL